MYARIATNINPSIRSNMPPCPGNILPVSLIFSFLFKYETLRSPNCAANESTIANR